MPPLATAIGIHGANTLTGNIGTLPFPPGISSPSGYNISIRGNNTLYGNIATLPTGAPSVVNSVTIWGLNTVTGNYKYLPSDYRSLDIGGGADDNHSDAYGNTIWGDLSDFPSQLVNFNLREIGRAHV